MRGELTMLKKFIKDLLGRDLFKADLNCTQDAELERFIHKENMPIELARAKLMYSESRAVAQDNSLYGDIDQGFLNSNGEVILVDTKVRERKKVSKKDIVQLSSYRWILLTRKVKVASYGYVRFVNPNVEGRNRISYEKVQLMASSEVQALINEYQLADNLV